MDDYLGLDTDRPVELSRGCLEVLPMPTDLHQAIQVYLSGLLHAFITSHAPGFVRTHGLRVRLWKGKLREPEVLYMRAANQSKCRKTFWLGADLVMEIVSGGKRNRNRDLVIKRKEYAKAGIPEYWIIDPKTQRITVLALDGAAYRVRGEFTPGTEATSLLLPGFTVNVNAVFGVPHISN